MGADPTRIPVLVGIGTATRREEDPRKALPALDLMVEAARAAGADCGDPGLLAAVERIAVPRGRSTYADPGRAIARAIGAERARSVLSTVGVLQQSLISDACRRIASGEMSVGLMTGGDAGYRILRTRIMGVEAPDTEAPGRPDELWAPRDELRHPAELTAGLKMPVGLYAILDSAFRARHGRSVDVHRRRIATLYARFTAIAAQNPHAWSRAVLEPDAIRMESDRNPMQAFPYTRRHCSSWNVDQAAALLICSEAEARARGLDPARFVYPLAASESNHMVPVVARRDLGGCPGARIAGEAALSGAGLQATDLDLVELYSCFPVAVQAYASELGIPPGRDLTVTGGMPFAGGPYNNYVLQATARMAELLRAGAGRTGMVASVSGVLTKQGFGVWSTNPPRDGFVFADVTDEVAVGSHPLDVIEDYRGAARIAGHTVVHEAGSRRAIVVADAAGKRVLATSTEPDLLDLLETQDVVGREIDVTPDGFRLAPEPLDGPSRVTS